METVRPKPKPAFSPWRLMIALGGLWMIGHGAMVCMGPHVRDGSTLVIAGVVVMLVGLVSFHGLLAPAPARRRDVPHPFDVAAKGDAAMHWVAGGRDSEAEPDPDFGECMLMRVNARARLLGETMLPITLVMVCFSVAQLASNVWMPPAWHGIAPALALVALWLMLESYFGGARLDDDGIVIFRPLRRAIAIRWDEIESVRYGRISARLKFCASDRRGARLAILCHGLGTLRDYLDRHVPADRWEAVRALLPGPIATQAEPDGDAAPQPAG